jgi:hypothetical protein
VSKHVEAPPPENFLDALRSFTNQKMWDFMHLDDDGEWISEAIRNGTLDVAHDGSYQPEIRKDVCSTAVWVRCRATKKQMFVSFAEKSLHASSYRSEVLGAIAAQLILRAATRNVPAQYQEVPTYCDNKGVLNHGSQAEKELKEKQAQFDVLHVMKTLIAESPVKSAFQWTEGHSVEKKGLRHCTHPEIMNDLVDRLTDVAHHRSIQLQNFIESDFPFEKLRLKHNGKKVTGNLCREMDNLTGERNALKYFAESGRISRENFQTV